MQDLSTFYKPISFYLSAFFALFVTIMEQVSSVLSVVLLVITICYTIYLTWHKAIEVDNLRKERNKDSEVKS